MGVTISDVVTSAPSMWGAANAVSASYVFPLAAFVAVPLVAVVSDPAQMWHAGDRYGRVAGHLRSAREEIGRVVARHADADHWAERGKDAFLANRVKPYQAALEQAAGMYDDMDHTLKGCAIAYSIVGLSSAAIGSAVLSYVAELLAMAVMPGVNATATVVGNARMLQAGELARAVIGGLAKTNGVVAAILSRLTSEAIAAKGVQAGLGAAGMALGGFYVGGRGAPSFHAAETTVNWPKQVPAGAGLPEGYRAPSAADQAAIRNIDPDSIKTLGKELERSVGGVLGAAYDQACGNDVGYPGFGLIGLHLAHAHAQMRSHGAQQLAACRDTPGTWLPGLTATAGNWAFAEQANAGNARHAK